MSHCKDKERLGGNHFTGLVRAVRSQIRVQAFLVPLEVPHGGWAPRATEDASWSGVGVLSEALTVVCGPSDSLDITNCSSTFLGVSVRLVPSKRSSPEERALQDWGLSTCRLFLYLDVMCLVGYMLN